MRITPSMIPVCDNTDGIASVPAPTTIHATPLAVGRKRSGAKKLTSIQQIDDAAKHRSLASAMADVFAAASCSTKIIKVSDAQLFYAAKPGPPHLAMLPPREFPSDIVEYVVISLRHTPRCR